MLYEVREEAVKLFNEIMADKYLKRNFCFKLRLGGWCNGKEARFCGHQSARKYWERFLKRHHVNWARGASKLVLIWENLNYVVKIPLFDESFNYCGKEAWVYKEACRWGYDFAFAPCCKLGHYSFEYNGERVTFPFYAMEKVNCNANALASWLGDSRSYEYSSSESYDADSCDVIDWMDDYYNGKIKEIVDWLSERCNAEDLHGGNFGITKEGSPVFVDYSGYGCDSWDPYITEQ